jgi:hypothetical protein
MTTELLRIVLPIELTNGNDGRGYAWQRSASRRKKLGKQLAAYRREPFSVPVVVEVTRILGKGQRLWDSSSIGRGSYKEVEDTLVELGWFHDDGPKWIVQTIFAQSANRRNEGPAVEIVVKKA